MSGLMEDVTTETGRIITCTVVVSTHGRTAESMKENTLTIANTGMVSMYGKMVANTKDFGKMGSNTVRAHINRRTDRNVAEFGRMGSASSGWMSDLIFDYLINLNLKIQIISKHIALASIIHLLLAAA